MDLPARIFLDPKVKNGVDWELENGKKAINESSNVKIKHGWGDLKSSKVRN